LAKAAIQVAKPYADADADAVESINVTLGVNL
jgi:hypothetical protein